jgi:hypothetical protein
MVNKVVERNIIAKKCTNEHFLRIGVLDEDAAARRLLLGGSRADRGRRGAIAAVFPRLLRSSANLGR